MRNRRRDPLLVLSDAELDAARYEFVRLAAEHRLPAIYEHRAFAAAGWLMSYGADIDRITNRAASYVDNILKGAKPGQFPLEQPTTIGLVINLKTAQVLGGLSSARSSLPRR
jgi:putative tryptophan/tyrosine transport system substrate-binding protein